MMNIEKMLFKVALIAMLIPIACTNEKNEAEKTAVPIEGTAESAYLPVPTVNPIQGTPLQIIKKVADGVIERTSFKYRLLPAPDKKVFDYVKFIDFGRTFDLNKPAIAYALTSVTSVSDTVMQFDVSHTDALKIWVNGEAVYEKDGNRQVKITPRERDIVMEFRFSAKLKKGANQILFKSSTDGTGDKWQVFFQPTGALEWQSPITGLTITLDSLPGVTPEAAALTSFLVIGMFPNDFKTSYEPEKEFVPGKLYTHASKNIAWTLPKIELVADVIGAHPMWGSTYNFNYHTAGMAWAMSILSEATGEAKYDDYARRYCDFMMESYPFVKYQVNELNGFQSVQHHMVNTPLLDFTSAPALPFVYRLAEDKTFENQKEVEQYVANIMDYIKNDQLRFDDGTFTRKTPFEYTTWTDDMYMGIPFLLHTARYLQNPEKKALWYDDAARQVIGFNSRTLDRTYYLYRHAQYSQRPGAKVQLWTRANGWGTIAMSEVLLHLPPAHPLYDSIKTMFVKHCKSFVKYQDARTGMWYNIIDNKDTYLETSGTALLVLGLARGINNGWLNREEFLPAVKRGWEGIKSQIEADGTVHNIIMGTGAEESADYYHSRPFVDNDTHGLFGVVLAAIECEKALK